MQIFTNSHCYTIRFLSNATTHTTTSPLTTSPSTTSNIKPEQTEPTNTSPEQTEPNNTSPEQTEPNNTSPKQTKPNIISSTETTPNTISPEESNTTSPTHSNSTTPSPLPQRKSTKTITIPLKFQNVHHKLPKAKHIVNSIIKFHHSKYINYNNITSPKTRHLINTINNTVEPQSYTQVIKDFRWIDAMSKEFQALEANNTWSLTTLPQGKIPIACKWVFKIKCNSDGSIERLNARLVAKDYTQKEGTDYTKTFPPVAKMVTVKTFLATAVHRNWHIAQLDMSNAFLYGDLHEEVYIILPQGNKQGITMSQRKYALELLHTAGVLDLKPSNIPIDPNIKLNDTDGEHLPDVSLYRALVGPKIHQVMSWPSDSVIVGGGFSLADLFPSSTLLAFLSSTREKLEKIHQGFDQILNDIIEEHKLSENNKDEVEKDLVDVLLHVQKRDDLDIPFSTDSIKAVILVSTFML
nr:reverse transcriptase, RNA-dependent DNA polymerase, Gag-polypeptide of LTR copia-type [Tanacetum cinerariifolium]